MILKGIETGGHVIVSTAKAQILSCDHQPVWQDNQLRSKTSWVTSVECMQVCFIKMGILTMWLHVPVEY